MLTGEVEVVFGAPLRMTQALREGLCPSDGAALAPHGDVHGLRWGYCGECFHAWRLTPDGQIWRDPRLRMAV